MPSKINKQDFQNRINELYPNEDIEILEYTGASHPGTYKCLNCGKVFSIYKMGDLQRKKRCCNECNYGRGNSESIREKKKKALNVLQEHNLTLIDYGYHERFGKPTIKFSCNKCGQAQEKILNSFLLHPNCWYCSDGAKKMNSAGIQAKIPKCYTLLEEYKGADTKVLFRHEECGFIWKTTPHNIISGCGCPKCAHNRSKGEKKIMAFLEKNDIIFEDEKSLIGLA